MATKGAGSEGLALFARTCDPVAYFPEAEGGLSLATLDRFVELEERAHGKLGFRLTNCVPGPSW